MSFVARVAASALLLFAGAGLVPAASASDLAHGAPNVPLHAAAVTATIVPDTVPAAGAILQPAVDTTPDEVSTTAAVLSPGLAFSTLAAAVAAQPVTADDDAELACLAGAVYFESHGEPLLGQLAVAKVILNRTRSGRYPTSICGVVTQRSQFSFVRGGVMPEAPQGAAYRTALAIAQIARSDQWADPSEGALSFHARRVSPGWAMHRVAAIGNHLFYR